MMTKATLGLLLAVAACRSTTQGGCDAGVTLHAAEAADALVACGIAPRFDWKCCPTAWQGNGACGPGESETDNHCWTACLPAPGLADGGYDGVTAQLTCGTDGIVIGGLGLFPCTPNR
jgi:hypothetical protein